MTPPRLALTVRVVSAGAAGIVVLAGCTAGAKGTDEMVAEGERVVAIAEQVVPAIAAHLDLTIADARADPATGGGLEGAAPTFVFEVDGEFIGPLPAQSSLESAMEAAGLVDLTTEQMNGTQGADGDPFAMGQDESGTVQVSVTLVTGLPDDGLKFTVLSLDQFTVSDEAVDEYFPGLVPSLDPSLAASAS